MEQRSYRRDYYFSLYTANFLSFWMLCSHFYVTAAGWILICFLSTMFSVHFFFFSHPIFISIFIFLFLCLINTLNQHTKRGRFEIDETSENIKNNIVKMCVLHWFESLGWILTFYFSVLTKSKRM